MGQLLLGYVLAACVGVLALRTYSTGSTNMQVLGSLPFRFVVQC